MESSLSPKQNSISTEPEASSLPSLLESGLNYAQQERFAEAVAFFVLASERLSPGQMPLFAVLDAFIQGYTNYWQAQHILQQASKRFAEVDAEQQAYLAALEEQLATLVGKNDKLPHSHTVAQVLKNSQVYQASQKETPLNESEVYQSSQLPLLSSVGPRDDQPSLTSQTPSKDGNALPALYITCFGRFEVRRFDQSIVLFHNHNGQTILRYLIAQPASRASTDALMAVIWPEDAPDVARHKLQVAISSLRRSLSSGRVYDSGQSHIQYKTGFYQLNPAISLRSDVDEFLLLYQAGRQTSGSETLALYEQACHLYTGPFLVEDLYADWSSIRREQLSRIYLTMCTTLAEHYLEAGQYEDAIHWAMVILKENRCDEAAHRLLMGAYAAENRRNEAIRQYRHCQQILFEDLGVQPMPETMKLFQSLLSGEDIASHETKIERK